MLTLTIAWSIEVSLEAPELRLEAGRVLAAGALEGLEPGAPALPVIVRRVGLPEGALVEGVELVEVEEELVSDSFPVKTLEMPRVPGVPAPEVRPFQFKGRWPQSPVRLAYQGFSRGRGVAFLLFFPAASDGKRLWRVKRVKLKLRLRPAEAPKYPVSLRWAKVLEAISGSAAPPDRPVPRLDMLIITSSGLAPAFDSLVRWRRLQGYRVKVVSLEEAQAWPGTDLPDRIRNLIRFYAQNWGVELVLLGGDKTIIPHRIAYQPIGYPQYGDSVATDLYYACLDGSWDPDGDGLWGTYPEQIDFLPDVAVARLPVRTQEEVLNYFRKLKVYEMGRGVSGRALVHAADLFTTGDGAYYGRRVAQVLGTTLSVDSLYEAQLDHDITPDELLGKMSGAAVHFTISHGVWTRLLIDRSSGNSLRRTDALAARGTPTFSALVACFGNSPEASVGRALVLAPEGGSVGLFGSGKLDFADYGIFIADSVFSSLAEDNRAGVAYAMGVGKLAGLAACTKVWRHLIFAYNLLGDPALRVWISEPSKPRLSFAPAAHEGFEVKTEPYAVVSLSRGEEIAATRADETGTAKFAHLPLGEGKLELWVFAPGKKPYFTVIEAVESGKKLSVEIPSPAQPTPWDTSQLEVVVRNEGAFPARAVEVRLWLYGSAVGLTGEKTFQLVAGELEPGRAETLRVPVWFEPGEASAVALAYWDDVQAADTAGWVVPEPHVRIVGVRAEGNGLKVYFVNDGPTPAKDIWVKAGHLVALGGNLEPGRVGEVWLADASFPLEIKVGIGPKTYESLLVDGYSEPPVPNGVRVQPVPGGVLLTWDSSDAHYLVFVNGEPWELTEHASYTLQTDTSVKFQVAAVKNGMVGQPSPALTGEPGPRFGPFQPLYREEFASSEPVGADLTPEPGEELVLAGGDWVEVLSGRGERVARWREPGVLRLSPAVGDGRIWIATQEGVVVRDAHGRLLAQYRLPARPAQRLVLWDFDGDGELECAVQAANSRVYLLDDGQVIDKGPTRPSVPMAVAVWGSSWAALHFKGDTLLTLDGSRKFPTGLGVAGGEIATWDSLVFVAVDAGSTWFGVLDLAAGQWVCPPKLVSQKRYPRLALGDVNGDGTPEALVLAQDSAYALTVAGEVLAKAQGNFTKPVYADGAFLMGTSDGKLVAVGAPLGGFPLLVSLVGAPYSPTGFSAPPAEADPDGDGKLELVIPGTDGLMYSLDADFRSGWRGPRANPWNTGAYGLEMPGKLRLAARKSSKAAAKTITKDLVIVPLNESAGLVRYALYDPAGRRVAGGVAEVKGGKVAVSLSELPSGAYLLTVEDRVLRVVRLR